MLTVIPQGLTEVSTVAKVETGVEWEDNVTGEKYVYVKAGAAISANDFVTLQGSGGESVAYVATEARAAQGKMMGVSQIVVATNEYFWLLVKSKSTSINALAGAPADAVYYCTVTAGSIDNAGVTKLHGIYVHTALAGGVVGASINYPHPAV